MSKLTSALSTSHAVSLAAMEEASREGLRTADIEHMLLALVLDADTAGQVLRSMPITLDEARAAVAAQHTDQLQALGIHTPAPTAGKVVFHETGGYEWSERALEVMKQSGAKGLDGGAPAMLRALLNEPSGLIGSLLARLDTSPESVTKRLDEALQIPPHAPRNKHARSPSGSASQFIPASVDRVWESLADPLNIPQWDPSIAHIEESPATGRDLHAAASVPRVGNTWITRARTEFSGGEKVRVKPGFIVRRVELTEFSEPHLIEWVFAFPDSPKANVRRVRIALEPAAGGTQLRMVLAWEPPTPRKRNPGLRLLLRPLVRFSIWIQLSQLGDGISRMFR